MISEAQNTGHLRLLFSSGSLAVLYILDGSAMLDSENLMDLTGGFSEPSKLLSLLLSVGLPWR